MSPLTLLFAALSVLPSVALAAEAAPAALAAPARLGPPLLCFPIDTGGQDTLPTPDERLPPGRVAPAAVALLAASDSGLAHMETLRRAVLHLQGDRGVLGDLLKHLEDARQRAESAVAALEAAGLRPDAALRTRAVLARFDLAYGRAAAAEAGLRDEKGLALVPAELVAVRAALPKDGALALGAALVSWSLRDTHAAALHLQDALATARAGDELLGRNAQATFGLLTGRRDLDALAAWATSEREEV